MMFRFCCHVVSGYKSIELFHLKCFVSQLTICPIITGLDIRIIEMFSFILQSTMKIQI